ncbi:MAG: hypothetical protein VX498_05175, partial [Myxococcota bacterium]|nr:hypothetical protein [Myxococcota bacterium]
PDNAWAEVGVGDSRFESIEAGHLLEVERGSQGGMHVWISMRTAGIDPGPTDMWQGLVDGSLPLIGFSLEAPDGILTPDNSRPHILSRVGEEYWLLENLVTFDHFSDFPDDWSSIDWDAREAELEAVDLQLTVRVADAIGTELEHSTTVRLDFPPRPGDEEGSELDAGEPADDDDSGEEED